MQTVPYKVIIEAKLEFSFDNCKLSHVRCVFLLGLGKVFSQVLSQVLRHYAKVYKESGVLNKLLSHEGKLTWKQLEGKEQTCLHTLFGKIWIPQLQIRLHHDGGHTSQCITRLLLGVSKCQRIPDEMKQIMGLLSSLCSYRTAQYCTNGLLGVWRYGIGSFHRATQWLSSCMDIVTNAEWGKTFIADGTGVATLNTGKRGSELKVLVQMNQLGKLYLSNISIGRYGDKEQWTALFAPLKEVFTTPSLRRELQVIMDGCKAILAAAKSIDERIKIQRDVWHIGHQVKYYSWKDSINDIHKATLIRIVFKAIFPKAKVSRSQAIEHLTNAILLCDKFGYKHTMSFLTNAAEHLYTHYEIEMPTVYSSKVERMMRTVNQRMDMGVWSEQGALAVAKIRLAYFYNGFGRNNQIMLSKNRGYNHKRPDIAKQNALNINRCPIRKLAA